MPLDLGVEYLDQGLDVSAVTRLEAATNDLDVLPRHRLLRQLDVGVSVLAVPVEDEPRHLAIAKVEQVRSLHLYVPDL